MKSQERDYDDILRRALRAAAESVEPAADGLDRIRGRVSARHLSPFMLLIEVLDDYFRPLLLLLEAGAAGALSALARLWSRAAQTQLPGRGGRALDQVRQRPRAAHRSQPPPAGLWAGLGAAFTRLRPAASWLKPVLAVGGAVGIVVAGVFTLGQVQQAITPANQISRPGATHHRASTAPTPPAVLVPIPRSATPSSAADSSAGAGPTATCSPRPKAKASATPTKGKASATPTPTVSVTPTVTPTDTSTAIPPPPTYTIPYHSAAAKLDAVGAKQLTSPCTSPSASAKATATATATATAAKAT